MRWRRGACTQMERRCKRKLVSRWSPETDEMRRPNSERNCAPSAFTGPRVSKAMGTNTWVAGNSAYFSDLRTAECSAAEPAESAVCDKHGAAQVLLLILLLLLLLLLLLSPFIYSKTKQHGR